MNLRCVSKMGGLDDLRRRGFDISLRLHDELLNSQQRVLEEIEKTWFFQYVSIEFYENGRIKYIERRLDCPGIISMGILFLVAGIAVCMIGPSTVVEAARELMRHIPRIVTISV